ncbi:NAD-dependent malic enzyme [Candidatus Peregrinibacteria bacterium HGW-Peregrinibacteria-1]|jgi:malate dehydrogenase (oxaloacetate-decarboxylating)|nr:MAG: NAD-dependent malic enzyme [Candidatus Peregrinibacteria bacterium HGW-Peregrinibacteria-1]
MTSDVKKRALELHEKYKGKISVESKVSVKNRDDLSVFYTPGVAEPCLKIAENKDDVYKYTAKGNLVAVITDGSAVLGLGNIGAEAGMPVMEGKCVLFKEFGGVDAFPIALATQDVDEIVQIIKGIAPSFGGINLEDISAPRCFEVEERLIEELDIPVFHDDQHGTAIVCLAGLINAMKVVGKKAEEIEVVVNGSGAAGVAIVKLFQAYGIKHISIVDSVGLIYKGRGEMNETKDLLAETTNLEMKKGGLDEAVKGADVFVGVSRPGVLTTEMVRTMNRDAIVFAMANPVPEIMPDEAIAGGAAIVATGRSDFPNQINNVLVFPGLFRGVLDARKRKITVEMKLKAAQALADFVAEPCAECIIPGVFDEGVAKAVAEAVK